MAETTENKFKQIYKSEPGKPYETWFAPKDAEIKFPYVEEAPDPSFKTPMYDWSHYRWYDGDGAAQGLQLGQLKDQVEGLKEKVQDSTLNHQEIDAINEQIGSIVGMLSEAAAASTEAPTESTDKDADNKGGDK